MCLSIAFAFVVMVVPRPYLGSGLPLGTLHERYRYIAVTYARKACEQTEWKDADCIDTLAAAYAEAGQFANAIKCQRKALEDPGFRESSGKEARARLELYKAGRPYREKAAGVP